MPGLGKTRAFIEIGEALAAAEQQKGRWMVNISITYNNGNPPIVDRTIQSSFDDGLIGAEKALLLRVLSFAFFPCEFFAKFALDFPRDLLENLSAEHVIGLIHRIAQEQFGHANGTLFIGIDEVNFLLDNAFDESGVEKHVFLQQTMRSFVHLSLNSKVFVFGLLAGTIVHHVTQVSSEISHPIELLPMGLLSPDHVENLLDEYSRANPRWSTWRTCRALRVLLADFATLPRLAENLLLTVEKSLNAGIVLENVDFVAVVNSLCGYLPIHFDFSRCSERIVRDALLCNPVQRVSSVDAERTITYSDLERNGVIALTASQAGEFCVQFPFALFRRLVSPLDIQNAWVRVLKSLCNLRASNGSDMINWQGFEEMHTNVEALREMLLAEKQEFIDVQSFYCVDSPQISVDINNGAEIKLRKEVNTGTPSKRFPATTADVDLSSAATRINDVSHAHTASITNASGAVFDSFSIRDVRGMKSHPSPDIAVEERAHKKPRNISAAQEEEEEKEEDIMVTPILFCGQQRFYRNTTTAVSKDMIRSESEKVSNVIDNRMPHILTNVATRLAEDALTDLPSNCVVLSGTAVREFYGPVFSPRIALFSEPLSQHLVNANTATMSALLTVPHITLTLAKRIMNARQQQAFSDWNDLRARVNMLPKDTRGFFCF